jgi:hypothetical protein
LPEQKKYYRTKDIWYFLLNKFKMKFVNLALLLIFICNSMQRTAIDLDKFNDPVKDEMDSVEESRMVK